MRQIFEIGSFEVSAEQAIPTALTTTSSPALGSDLPFFNSERVRFRTSSEWVSLFEMHVGHFGFSGLPSSVAAESRLLGNDVGGIGPSSIFMSRFNGVEGGASVTWHAGRGFKPTLGVAGISNLAARSGRGRAFLLFGEMKIPTSSQVLISPHLDFFRTEGDATVGSYSPGSFGHENRIGFSVGVRADLAKSGLTIGGSFTRAAIIAATPFQSDLTGFVLNLRKSYDLLP